MGQLEEIIAIMDRDPSPGVIVIDEQTSITDLTSDLERQGFCHSHTWCGLINCFRAELPSFIFLDRDMSKEMAEILEQYSKQKSHIEIFDKQSKEMIRIRLRVQTSKVILIARKNSLL